MAFAPIGGFGFGATYGRPQHLGYPGAYPPSARYGAPAVRSLSLTARPSAISAPAAPAVAKQPAVERPVLKGPAADDLHLEGSDPTAKRPALNVCVLGAGAFG